MTKTIAVTGRSGSGKTSLIIKILPLLLQKKIRTGTIKQTHHNVTLDNPGKDSYLHRKSGSIQSAILTPDSFGIFRDRMEGSIQDFTEKFFSDFDLVILEGFKNENVYKMEVVRLELNKKPLYEENNFQIHAVIASKKDQCKMKNDIKSNTENDMIFLDLNSPENIADHIEKLL